MQRKWLSVTVAMLFLSAVVGPAFGMSPQAERIIPTGTVYLHQDGKKVGQFSREAPLPNDTLLQCEGNCGMKLKDLYLVGLDQSWFLINSTESVRNISLEKGTVGFALKSLPLPLVITTPTGTVTANHAILQASATESMIKGYVKVTDQSTELSILEGALVLNTKDGVTTVRAGERMLLQDDRLLAQATTSTATTTSNENDDAAGGTSPGTSPGAGAGTAVAGALAAVVLGAIIYQATDDDDDDDDASPSRP